MTKTPTSAGDCRIHGLRFCRRNLHRISAFFVLLLGGRSSNYFSTFTLTVRPSEPVRQQHSCKEQKRTPDREERLSRKKAKRKMNLLPVNHMKDTQRDEVSFLEKILYNVTITVYLKIQIFVW